MKKTLRVLALVLVLAMSFLMMVSCSTYPKVKKAFEKEGYSENATIEALYTKMLGDLNQTDSAIKVHMLCNTATHIAIIIEFNATDEMIDYYKNNESARNLVSGIQSNEDVKVMYNALCDAGYASGSCLVLPVMGVNDIKNIVKKI